MREINGNLPKKCAILSTKHLLEFGTVPKPVVVPASQTQNWAAPPAEVTKVNLDAFVCPGRA
jgi:hypothetical protein